VTVDAKTAKNVNAIAAKIVIVRKIVIVARIVVKNQF